MQTNIFSSGEKSYAEKLRFFLDFWQKFLNSEFCVPYAVSFTAKLGQQGFVPKIGVSLKSGSLKSGFDCISTFQEFSIVDLLRIIKE